MLPEDQRFIVRVGGYDREEVRLQRDEMAASARKRTPAPWFSREVHEAKLPCPFGFDEAQVDIGDPEVMLEEGC